MGKLIVSENVSLDGVIQDPSGEEGFEHGGWFRQFGGADLPEWGKVELAEAQRADALLLGRRSDQWFADRWLSRSDEWANRLNSMPKYVVSASLDKPKWTTSGDATVLRGDVAGEVTGLKQSTPGDIIVYASGTLVHALLEHDLVDEVRLTVFPVILGDGGRLFGPSAGKMPLRLVSTRMIGENLAYLTYERSGRAS